MNTGRIRLVAQRLEPIRTQILISNGPQVRRYSIKVNQFTTKAYFGRQIVERTQIIPTSVTGLRFCSANRPDNKFDKNCIDASLVATYGEIVSLPKHPEKLLIDVREPEELAAKGAIPTSINIPLKTVSDALKLSPADFQAKYGRKKPGPNDPIIFSCCVGVRSGNAAYEADKLGFKNVKNYVGSHTEYAEINSLASLDVSPNIPKPTCRLPPMRKFWTSQTTRRRGADELAETGTIPTSIHIPLANVEQALKLSEDEFKAKYGRGKPQPDTEIIFHCKLGGRAQKATDVAVDLGFKNARNYKGSWTEWAEKQRK
ncbi:uncharacterized protein LOC131688372 [Topomyia yanbarensis]|uniref:uncharacterized protein LOC131688372 n=1 Tax=Topomyia yanbarensis TaxID=2498891 RepID=UPI00273B8F89|nr:uncharacterized protein LOC131688372 [Topomyia yanbarensis]